MQCRKNSAHHCPRTAVRLRAARLGPAGARAMVFARALPGPSSKPMPHPFPTAAVMPHIHRCVQADARAAAVRDHAVSGCTLRRADGVPAFLA